MKELDNPEVMENDIPKSEKEVIEEVATAVTNELEAKGESSIEEENVNIEKKDSKNMSSNVLITSFAISFFFAIFAPLEFYFSNVDDVWYDVYNLLPIILVAFLSSFVILGGIGVLLAKKCKGKAIYIYNFILAVLAVCAYVQGTFILVPYGEFNGEAIQWSNYARYNAASVVTWLGIIALAVVAFWRMNKEKLAGIVRVIMTCFFIMQFISMIIVGANNEGFKYKERLRTLSEGKWDYSTDKNFFIFILDTMDSRVLADYLSQDKEAIVNDVFEDFTLYRDTMGAFNLTDYALPQIMTGEYYLGDIPYQDYIENAYTHSELLNRLEEEDWITRFHTGQSMPEGEGGNYIDNLAYARRTVEDYPGFTKAIYNLVLFKYVPTPIKQYVYYEAERLSLFCKIKSIEGVDDMSIFEDDDWDEGIDDWDNNEFFWNLYKVNASETQKCFNMYHLKGIHAVRDLDGEMNVITDPEHYYSLAGETPIVLYIMKSWMNKLKENGVYDNSVIIFMGDHGASAYADPENFTQCPILAIKGFGEKHAFNVSDVPVSYDDLQDIYKALLDGKTGLDVMEQALAEDGINPNDYEQYDAKEMGKRYLEGYYKQEEVGRRRIMIFHKFTGDLVGNGKGGDGYELYTDYPCYVGQHIQSTGKIYKP